jgi:hypothetical protein
MSLNLKSKFKNFNRLTFDLTLGEVISLLSTKVKHKV